LVGFKFSWSASRLLSEQVERGATTVEPLRIDARESQEKGNGIINLPFRSVIIGPGGI